MSSSLNNNKRLTLSHDEALSSQHTRQASILKEMLNTGGFFVPMNGGQKV